MKMYKVRKEFKFTKNPINPIIEIDVIRNTNCFVTYQEIVEDETKTIREKKENIYCFIFETIEQAKEYVRFTLESAITLNTVKNNSYQQQLDTIK